MEPDTSLELGSEELRKALEWELSLENSDLRSRAWYHGTIPRTRAEELLKDNGDFLIRDCTSRPGDYVLTCKCKGTSLHFVINKVIQQPNTVYEKIQFQFEDDCFDTVPGLVTYYVGNKNSISAASGAVISKPINRTMPLSYYATRYGLNKTELPSYSSVGGLTPDIPVQTPIDAQDKFVPIRNSKSPVPPALPMKQGFGNEPIRYHATVPQTNSDHLSDSDDLPPPKPSRISVNRQLDFSNMPGPDHLYHEPVFDCNAINTQNFNFKTGTRKTSGETRFSFLDRASVNSVVDEAPIETINENDVTLHSIPDLDPVSRFRLEMFVTPLLPNENKPLEATSLLKVRSLIMSAGPKMLANHLTRSDLEVLKCSQDYDLGLGVLSGLELIVLPQGIQLCSDLLERTNCLKYFVAILILTCGSEMERAQMIHKWIQVAADTKAALGNLYGFTGLMMGLALPQVDRLKSTWLTLRRLHTDSALMFETKLRPTLKAMQECTNPQAPNTCIPYLYSLATILQRHLQVVTADPVQPKQAEQPVTTLSGNQSPLSAVPTLGLQWEQTSADYGLQLLLSHLENGRRNASSVTMYKRNSEIALEGTKFDDQLLDVFHTEFHLRFLWGSRGAIVASTERFAKLDQVLNVMSERCEIPCDN